jgi:cell division protein FtsI (penicillin-binding protein 3)
MRTLDTPRGRWIRMRMGVLCGLLALGLGLVVSAGWDLMVRDGDAWRELAQEQRERRLHVLPKRGTIYDRNGSALAVTVEVPSVSLDSVELLSDVPPEQVPLVARDAANRIAQALGLDPAIVERKILSKRRFNWLKRRISTEEVERIRELSAAGQGKRRIRGLIVEGEGHRYYPRRELAGTLLGFVAPDGEGKDGFELAMNDDLKGHVEALRGLRDRAGHLLFSDGIQDDQALAGHNIELTIDQGIQYVAEQALDNAVRNFEARAGTVVVVQPDTGEILAMANFPDYNPNDYEESDPRDRRNRSVTDSFEPGSVMKMFTVSTALKDGVVTPTQQLYCEKGMMPIDNIVIRDTHPSGWLSLPQILALSSNICAAKMGLSLGGQRLYEGLRNFGFGERTGIPLPGEASGTLRPRGRAWVPVETAAASFGQGISVTALQLAMGASAIANGGKLLQPILIKRVTTATGEVVREAVPIVRRRVIPEGIAHTVAQMLVSVTEGEGTGTAAAIPGYEVAGKTSTAQKTDPATGRYSLDKYTASFVGFVPAEKPAVVIAVVVDEPMVAHAGGEVAAPVFRRVARMSLKYMGLTPQGTKPPDLKVLAHEPDPANATFALLRQAAGERPPVQVVAATGPAPKGKIRVPDMTGWPVRESVERAIQLGVHPRVQGTGLLARELPAPGSVLDKGGDLILVFEPRS